MNDDDPNAPEPGESGPIEGLPKARRWPRVALGAIAGLLVVGSLAIALGFGPFVRWLTLREAARLGVELELGRVEVSWESVTVLDFGFSLHGVGGVRGHVDRLTVKVDGLQPRAIEANGVDLDLEGNATDLGLAVAGFVKDHAEIFALPAEADDVDVTWRPKPEGEPWLVVTGATISPHESGGELRAKRVKVVGFSVGRVGARWQGDDAEVVLGLGESDLDDAPVHVKVEHALARPEATFTLRPTRLERLAGPLAMALPIEGVTASGVATLTFLRSGPNAPIEGKLEARFEGYRPPVPPEVKGIVFGDDTEVTSRIALSEDRKKVTFDELEVIHGAFRLTGEGSAVRNRDHAVLAMALEGTLSCNQLAAAAANIRVGGQVGSWLGKLAGRVVTGSVGVVVTVSADTRALDEATMKQQLGVGCGLRPDRILPGMPELPELPKDMPELPKIEIELPKLPKLQIP
ncbi:MAG TPA: hypothetical protein ENK57_00160 [Polyangiaceae bacterium]|nr:hypothetical protein [Polyangiaceae bacterium]